MSIPVKIISGTESGTIKKGNFAFGVSKDRTYGPTSDTGFYKGHNIPDGGYVVYLDRGTASPSAYVCSNGNELIGLVNSISGENFSTVSDAVSWINTQSSSVAFDKPLNSIITEGLLFNLEANNLMSYSGTGSTWYNMSSSNNGTLTNGPTFDSRGWISFDGVDDRVHMDNTLSTIGDFNSYTVNFWIKLNSLTSNNALLGNASGSTTVGNISIFSDSIDDTVRIRIVIYVTNSTGGNTAVSLYPGPYGSSYVDINLQEEYWTKWRYITIRFDSEVEVDTARRYRIFIDGESKATTIRNTDLNNSINTSRRIGVRGTTTNHFDGNISLIQIYNRPLTTQEIRQNYYQSPIVTDGLIFSVDAGNLVSYEPESTDLYNLSGTHSSSLVNGVGYSKNNGGIWIFDGINDRIQTDFNISGLVTSIQISVRPIGNSVGYYIAQSAGGADGNGRFLINTFNTLNNDFILRIGSNTINTSGGFNQWFILSVTRDSNGLTSFYKNGVLINTFTNNTPFVSGRILDIGGSTFVSDRSINGNIGNVLIYNRSLSQEEITQNFNAQRQRFGI
jgi:hypothetical protein